MDLLSMLLALYALDYLQLVSAVATVSTITLFSTGILTCRQIHQNRNVGSIPHLPFVACSVNCALWSTYGILKSDGTVTLVNVVGLLLQISYIVVYLIYTNNKARVQRDVAIALVIVLPVVLYYMCFASNLSSGLEHLGIICNIFTILFFASPLSTMAEVVRNQSTESMSLPLSVMATVVSGSWAIYGVLVSDVYIQVPNVIGLILSLVQMALFAMYGVPKKKMIVSMETPMV